MSRFRSFRSIRSRLTSGYVREDLPYYDPDSDDEYEAARDAYLTGEGPPVTSRQREEAKQWDAEHRRLSGES